MLPPTTFPPFRLFVDLKRLSDPVVRDHLQLDSPSRPELSIQTFPYESVYTELQAICAALGPKDKVWICDKASCALTQVIPKVRRGHLFFVLLRFAVCLFAGLQICSGVPKGFLKALELVSAQLCFSVLLKQVKFANAE